MRAFAVTGLTLLLLSGSVRAAVGNRCLGDKFSAAANRADVLLTCQAVNAAQRHASKLTACVGRADAAFAKAITKADDQGPCSGDLTTCACLIDVCVGEIEAALAPLGNVRCAVSTRKYAASLAKRELLCNSKAVSAGNSSGLTDCVGTPRAAIM